MKTNHAFFFSAFIAILLGSGLLDPLSAQTNFPPVVYYQFDTGTVAAPQDASVNGLDLTHNTNFLYTSLQGGIVGGYQWAPHFPTGGTWAAPHRNIAIDDSVDFEEISLEFWFRTNNDFRQGYTLFWQEKLDIFFTENFIQIRLKLDGWGWENFTFQLQGTANGSASALFDGGWHHMAFTFTPKTGTGKIYLDGLSSPQRTWHLNPTPHISAGYGFYVNSLFAQQRFDGHLDEIALYNVVLPAELVWQHYQEGLQGLHYDSVLTFTGVLPIAPFDNQDGIDPLEFPPGYPDVPYESWALLDSYPGPRYATEMPRLIPWLADPGTNGTASSMGYSSLGTNHPNMDSIMARKLALNYNYFYFLGTNEEYFRQRADTAITYRHHYLLKGLQDTALADIPRFAFGSWGGVKRPDLYPGYRPYSYLKDQFLPDSFYMRAPTVRVPKVLNWAIGLGGPRLDSLRIDGVVNKLYFQHMIAAMDSMGVLPFVNLYGENDEACVPVSNDWILPDVEMGPDYLANGYTSFPAYQAARALQFRRAYRDSFQVYLDQINLAAGQDSSEYYWYNTGGIPTGSSFQYDTAAAILKFNDGYRRATPYFYPQSPYYWRTGVTNSTGWQHLVRGRWLEMRAGDSIFMPSISGGYRDDMTGVDDDKMLRPANLLAALKGLAMLGADGYAIFMYDGKSGVPKWPGNWRMWQMAMPSYAQGLSSRFRDLLYGGYPLPGDLGVFAGNIGVLSTPYYTFAAGHSQNLVVARQLNGNAPRFAIFAANMRSINLPSHAVIGDEIFFHLHDSSNVTIFDSLQLRATAQGSTYLLDLQGGDTVFYQLDGWHESTDPYYWCRDFTLEAELFDQCDIYQIKTERPAGVAQGDFRDYTTYLHYESGVTLDTLKYEFEVKHAEQDTLYFWARARQGVTGSIAIYLAVDGVFAGAVPVTGSSWDWYNIAVFPTPSHPVQVSGLTPGKHMLWVLVSAPDSLDIDKFLLMRSAADFPQQSFSPQAAAMDSLVCFGDSAHFFLDGSTPDGCLQYLWEFGDGTRSRAAAPAHLYPYADTFRVHLTVTHPCLGLSMQDSLDVIVDAPFVDAGRDTMVCAGDSIQMNASASYFFKWREDSLVSSNILQQPMAWPDTSGYLHIDAWSPWTGCHNEDSVYVSVMELEGVYGVDQYPCYANLAVLEVVGGYHYQWLDPDTLLSNDTIRTPRTLLTDTTSFVCLVSDMCRCDTDTVTVTVYPQIQGGLTDAWPAVDTICHMDTVRFFTAGYRQLPGGLPPLWTPTAYLDAPRSFSPLATLLQHTLPIPSTTTVHEYIVSGIGCTTVPGQLSYSDTLQVVSVQRPGLLEWPYPGGWRDTLFVCGLDSLEITPLVNSALGASPTGWHWSPGYLFDDSTAMVPKMWVNSPTSVQLEISAATGCPATYRTLIMPSGIVGTPDSLYQCPGGDVALEVVLHHSTMAGSPGTISWQPSAYFSPSGSRHTLVSVPSSQWVYVTATNLHCSLTDSVEIILHGLPELLGPDTVRGCAGDTIPLIVEGASPVWWWRPPPLGGGGQAVGDSTSASTYTVFQGTPYTVFVASLDSFFCPGFDSVLVTWNDVISADTVTMCYGDTALLPTLSGGVSCAWSPNVAISDTSACDSVWVWPSGSSWYIIEWTDSLGCFAKDSVYVQVDSGCCHIPGAIVLDNALTSSLPSGTIANAHYVVRDTLTVDASKTFYSTVFEMDPGAVIHVLPGRNLDTDTCVFRSGCGLRMWGTILIDSVTALYKSNFDNFEDAEVAITSAEGGIYGLVVDTISRCYRGIQVLPYSGSHAGAFANTIIRGGAMLPPYDTMAAPWAGIDISNVNALNIGNSISQMNTFDSLYHGVYAVNSNIVCRGNHFVDMLPTLNPFTMGGGAGIYYLTTSWGTFLDVGALDTSGAPGSGPDQNRFEDSRYGVYVDGPADVHIYGNVFDSITTTAIHAVQLNKSDLFVGFDTLTHCRTGIYVGLSRNVPGHVYENTITAADTSFRTGIFLDGVIYPLLENAPFLVEHNDVELTGDGIRARVSDNFGFDLNEVQINPSASNLHGVKLEACEEGRVYNNWLDSDTSNISNNRTNVRGIYIDSSPESVVKCNEVKQFGWGIAFRSVCNSSIVRNNQMHNAVDGMLLIASGQIGVQGDTSDPTDNLWTGSFSNGQTHSVSSFGNTYDFFARPSAGSWGVTFPTSNQVTGPGAQPFQFISATAGPSFDPEYCQDQEEGGGGDDPDGLMAAIQSDAGDYPVWETENLWKTQAWAYETLLEDSSLAPQDTALVAFKAQTDSSAMGYLLVAEVSTEAKAWQDAEAALKAATPEGLVEESRLSVWQNRLAWEQGGAVDTTTLREVARLCPDDGGKAVFEARMLLLAMAGERIDSAPCVAPTRRRGPSQAEAPSIGEVEKLHGDIKVWPNPTSHTVRFLWTGSVTGRLELFSPLGVVTASLLLKPRQAETLQLEDMADGLYQWRFMPDGTQEPISGRLAIVK